jgi:hypothetical protein
MRLANQQGDDRPYRCRLPTNADKDRRPDDEHPHERTEEGSDGRQRDAGQLVDRYRPWVRPRREDRRPDVPVWSGEEDPLQVRTVSRADDIEVDGDALRKLRSIDHGACLAIGVGAIGVGFEYRTAGNGGPGTMPRSCPILRKRPISAGKSGWSRSWPWIWRSRAVVPAGSDWIAARDP